jgi:hypothetical protein
MIAAILPFTSARGPGVEEYNPAPMPTSADQTRMQEEVRSFLVAALDGARVESDPFSHVYLRGTFPPHLYERMLETLPDLGAFRPDNPAKYGHNARKFHSAAHDTAAPVSCRYTMPLDDAHLASTSPAQRAVWASVGEALASPEVKARIFALFAADLCRRFRTDVAGLARLEAHARVTLIRDLSGYWIAPHPDTRAKIVTVQFYLAGDTSQRTLGTTLYRRRFTPKVFRSLSNLFEPVRRLEFLPNTGYLFPVGSRSWHGREEIPAGAGERNSILLVYYRDPSREW